MDGARWVQENVLKKHPDATLQVYTVWLDELGTDSKDRIDVDLMTDPRVRQFWDEDLVIASWFAQQFGGQIPTVRNIASDAYFLFDGNANWDEKPAPLLGTGVPIIRVTNTLRQEITPLFIP